MKTIFDLSKESRSGYSIDKPFSSYKLESKLLREKPLNLPEVSENEVARHYTALSKKAYGVDDGFYPLGSCTMKYNSKIAEKIASFEGFTAVHPLQNTDEAQGTLGVMFELQNALALITGMDNYTLMPAAGAHGEFTALQMIRAYHLANGDEKRVKIIVPDSAHGTNPASCTMVGFEVISIPSVRGMVDLEQLEKVVGEDTAGLMLTNPNTLGIFEKDIIKINDIVHNAGGLVYYDGANLNAIMGNIRPGDMGFDVVHLNLHKTFGTPHGGGGPGSGPVGCKKKLKEYLPQGKVIFDGNKYTFFDSERTIGRVKMFWGNISVLIKALVYIKILGDDGLRNASSMAVLNANYMLSKLKDKFKADIYKLCMHEFVLSLEDFKEKTTVSALDYSKAMIDEGMHPGTMYFPQIVHEALMIEPTETETIESLDTAIEKMLMLYDMAHLEPERLKKAPLSTLISRPDDVAAARNPVLSYEFKDLN